MMPEEIHYGAPLPSAGADQSPGGMVPGTGLLPVPGFVRAAGDQAVAAYVAFLDRSDWSHATRTLYRQQAGRFFGWAAGRNLVLRSISPADVSAYAAEIGASSSPQTTATYLTGLRAAFRHLVTSGVLAENPCDPSHSAARQISRERPARKTAGRKETAAAGLPMLDLLTMLAHMEADSLQRIFDQEEMAWLLLEQVRWPDGPVCPGCGAGTDDEPSTRIVCPACSTTYTVTTGTMLEGSSVPVRHWLFLIHQMDLAEPGCSDEQLQRHTGLDPREILSLCRRISEALKHAGVPSGDERKRAIATRNKELIQDEVVRDIVKYGELTAARDWLVQARDQGTSVVDLPAGMTPDEALHRIEEQIAELDADVVCLEDGYLVSRPAELIAAEEDAGASQ
jgi:Transposase zinc-ribbon domain